MHLISSPLLIRIPCWSFLSILLLFNLHFYYIWIMNADWAPNWVPSLVIHDESTMGANFVMLSDPKLVVSNLDCIWNNHTSGKLTCSSHIRPTTISISTLVAFLAFYALGAYSLSLNNTCSLQYLIPLAHNKILSPHFLPIHLLMYRLKACVV